MQRFVWTMIWSWADALPLPSINMPVFFEISILLAGKSRAQQLNLLQRTGLENLR
jgi:hypothetical protein